MPIKKDETGKRWVEIETVVPGTPEQVWQAIATGPGHAAWFVNAKIEERVGGKITLDFGANGTSNGDVTIWEPPFRFGYVEPEWAEGAPPVATEITVVSKSGGRCVIRMVHSLFASSDDWDDQLEGFESGWPGFFEVLRVYLGQFAGKKAACFQVMGSTEGHQLDVWKRLIKSLDLMDANVGEERTVQQPENMSGRVQRVQQSPEERYIMLLLDTPAPGVAQIGAYGPVGDDRTNISIGIYLYGAEAGEQAALSKAKWKTWFDETFRPSS